MLAFAEMITVMAWRSSQQDTSNIQMANLIGEMKNLQMTIEKANENSSKLEQANYKLQIIITGLTAIATLVVIFPILKTVFEWLIPLEEVRSRLYGSLN